MQITPRLLFLVSGLAFAALMFWPVDKGGAGGAVAQARELVGHDRVILFSAPWCGYCDRLRADLQRGRVPFAERNVEASADAQKAWRLLGGRGVPLTLAGEDVHRGYDPTLAQRLAGAGR